MGKYASGKYAYAISDRSGLKFPYDEMVREWNGSLVHVSEFEPKQPQLEPKPVGSDPQALFNPRPQPASKASLILLDKDGENLSTHKLFDLIKSYEMNNIKILNFAIGGPYGHGQFIKQQSDKIISFGKMTWSHTITRLMLVEQLYRIECIFNNHPYHK